MSGKIESYLNIQNLKSIIPNMESERPFGLIDRGKGETAFLNLSECFKFICVLEFLPDVGMRGKHYHNHKKEYLYVIDGEMNGYYWLPDIPQEVLKVRHTKGDFITINTGLCHAYDAVTKTTAIEFSPTDFDIKDHSYPNNLTDEMLREIA